MKIVGIIVEFNPLHNGHIHYINEVKRLSNADIIIAVSSANFVMRGDFSTIDKFNKTKFALKSGVNIFVELPVVYTINNADIFAKGCVGILNTLGVNEIYFGSETNNIDELYNISNAMESEKYNLLIKKYLDNGNSYKSSSIMALNDLGFSNLNSNDTLGLAYINANKAIKSNIKFYTIKRIDSNYDDINITNSTIASAKAIRNTSDISNYVPSYINEFYINHGFNSFEKYINLLNYKINITSKNDLKEIMNVDEGIEGLIKKEAIKTFDDFNKLTSKRYTRSRINRIMLSILLNIKKQDIPLIPPYIRILGFDDLGREYVNTIKKNIPLIKKIKEGIHPFLDIEINASKIYSLNYYKDIFKEEFMPIIYEKSPK